MEDLNQATGSQDNKNIEDFEVEDQEEYEEYDEEEEIKKEGWDIDQTVERIAKASARFIPEKDRPEYIKKYKSDASFILELIGFEELTADMGTGDLTQLPNWARWLIALLGIAGPVIWHMSRLDNGQARQNQEVA